MESGLRGRIVCTRPEVIVSAKRCQRIVSNLLVTDLSLPVIGITFKANHLTGVISIIAIHSPTFSQPKVFDVYRNPKLYMEGQLHRLFQAEKLIKVVHDCKTFSAQLKQEQYITCHSMFDTQVAYTLKMEQTGLPSRLIHYEDLHRNVVGLNVGHLHSYMKIQERSDGNIWNKRPLSAEMLYALGEEVVSLRSEVYPRVLKYGLEEFEMRCALAARGLRKTADSRNSARHDRPPLLSINTQQAELLPKTKPLSSEQRNI